MPDPSNQNHGRISAFNTPLPHNFTFSRKMHPPFWEWATISLDRPVVFTSRHWTHDTRDLVHKPDKFLEGGYSGDFSCWSTRFWLCVYIMSILRHNRRPTNSGSHRNHYSHTRGLVNLHSKLAFISFPLPLPSSPSPLILPLLLI